MKATATSNAVSAEKTQKSEVKADAETEKPVPHNAAFLFWSQLVLLLVIIYFGIKYGGVALGMLGG